MRPLKFLQKIHIPFLRYWLASFLALIVAANVLGAEAVFLEWDENQEPNLAGYKVLYGTRSGNYTRSVSTGLAPQAEITGLDAGTTYYFAVQAVNTQSLHSPLSGEIAFTIPAAPVSQITVLAENGAPLANQLTTLSFEYASLVSKVQTKRITLKNNGSTPLNRLGITLDGTDPTSFSLSSPLPMEVSAAINGGFELGFSNWESTGNVRVVPHANAAEGGAILQFNGGNSAPGGTVFQRIATIPGTRYTLSFDAGAVAANFSSQKLGIRVTGDDTLISKSITLIGGGDSAVKWTNHSMDFMATSQSTLITLSDQSTVTNSIDLWIDKVRLTASEAPNLVSRTPRVTSLQPGESVSFDVAYRPAYPGPKSAALHISSDDPDDDPFNIQLAGSSNLTLPEVAVEFKGSDFVSGTASLNLATVAVGSSSTSQTLTIRNRGGSNLTNLALGIDGAHAGEFTTTGLLTPMLAPGASTTVQIFLKPTSGGSKTAALRIASNDLDESPFVIQLAGLASAPVAPEISVQLENGTELSSGLFISNLGVTNIGNTSPSIGYTIRNIGSSPLTGLKLAVDNNAFAFSNLSTTSLAPGAAATFRVSFKPPSVGLKSATLRISSNDADENPFNVGLAATGAAAPTPEIAVLQAGGSELASGQSNSQFGSAQVGTTSAARTFTIKNLGSASLANLAISSSNPQFTFSSLAATTLAPGASTSFSVSFKPGNAGAHSATLRISSNDADENPFDIHLAGTGVAASVPEIAVEFAGSSLPSGSIGSGFGNVTVGTNSAVRTFTIRNLGTATLANLAVSSSNPQFTFSKLTTTTLAPGATTPFSVTFKPGSAGAHSATLRISSNDADENPFDIHLAGTGVAASVPEIAVEFAGSSLPSGSIGSGFGNVTVGTNSAVRTFTIRNLGTANLANLAVSSSNPQFTFSKLTTTTLAPGATTPFSVTFKPGSAGAHSTTLRIASNDADENPFNIHLAGTGVAPSVPEIAVESTGASLASGATGFGFGNVNVGTNSAARTFTIRNLGTANLTNLALSSNNNQFVFSSLSTATLAPGASTSFSVTFKPATAGAHPATIRISSNDADENPFDIHFSGTGTMVNSPPEIAVYLEDGSEILSGNRTFLEFGDVSIGKTLTRTLTVRNLGGADLTSLNLSYGGFGITQFSVVGFNKSTLAPGASTTVKVNFTPTLTTTSITLIYLVSNDKDENPFTFIARGKGTPAVAAAPAALAAAPPSGSSAPVAAYPPPNTSVSGIAVVDDKKYLMLTATWLAGNRNYNEIVEVSPNLVDWYSGSNHTTTMISTPNILQVRDNAPVGSTPSRFIRLQPAPRAADR